VILEVEVKVIEAFINHAYSYCGFLHIERKAKSYFGWEME